MRMLRGWSVVLSLALLVSCGGDSATGPDRFVDDRPDTLRRLDAAQQRWRQTGLRDYRYQYRQSCFCAPAARAPVSITVRQGLVTEATFVETGQPVPDDVNRPTIDDLFADLREAAAADAAEIRAQFDASLGYPTQVYIDRSQQIADEELSFEASGVTPLR